MSRSAGVQYSWGQGDPSVAAQLEKLRVASMNPYNTPQQADEVIDTALLAIVDAERAMGQAEKALQRMQTALVARKSAPWSPHGPPEATPFNIPDVSSWAPAPVIGRAGKPSPTPTETTKSSSSPAAPSRYSDESAEAAAAARESLNLAMAKVHAAVSVFQPGTTAVNKSSDTPLSGLHTTPFNTAPGTASAAPISFSQRSAISAPSAASWAPFAAASATTSPQKNPGSPVASSIGSTSPDRPDTETSAENVIKSESSFRNVTMLGADLGTNALHHQATHSMPANPTKSAPSTTRSGPTFVKASRSSAPGRFQIRVTDAPVVPPPDSPVSDPSSARPNPLHAIPLSNASTSSSTLQAPDWNPRFQTLQLPLTAVSAALSSSAAAVAAAQAVGLLDPEISPALVRNMDPAVQDSATSARTPRDSGSPTMTSSEGSNKRKKGNNNKRAHPSSAAEEEDDAQPPAVVALPDPSQQLETPRQRTAISADSSRAAIVVGAPPQGSRGGASRSGAGASSASVGTAGSSSIVLTREWDMSESPPPVPTPTSGRRRAALQDAAPQSFDIAVPAELSINPFAPPTRSPSTGSHSSPRFSPVFPQPNSPSFHHQLPPVSPRTSMPSSFPVAAPDEHDTYSPSSQATSSFNRTSHDTAQSSGDSSHSLEISSLAFNQRLGARRTFSNYQPLSSNQQSSSSTNSAPAEVGGDVKAAVDSIHRSLMEQHAQLMARHNELMAQRSALSRSELEQALEFQARQKSAPLQPAVPVVLPPVQPLSPLSISQPSSPFREDSHSAYPATPRHAATPRQSTTPRSSSHSATAFEQALDSELAREKEEALRLEAAVEAAAQLAVSTPRAASQQVQMVDAATECDVMIQDVALEEVAAITNQAAPADFAFRSQGPKSKPSWDGSNSSKSGVMQSDDPSLADPTLAVVQSMLFGSDVNFSETNSEFVNFSIPSSPGADSRLPPTHTPPHPTSHPTTPTSLTSLKHAPATLRSNESTPASLHTPRSILTPPFPGTPPTPRLTGPDSGRSFASTQNGREAPAAPPPAPTAVASPTGSSSWATLAQDWSAAGAGSIGNNPFAQQPSNNNPGQVSAVGVTNPFTHVAPVVFGAATAADSGAASMPQQTVQSPHALSEQDATPSFADAHRSSTLLRTPISSFAINVDDDPFEDKPIRLAAELMGSKVAVVPPPQAISTASLPSPRMYPSNHSTPVKATTPPVSSGASPAVAFGAAGPRMSGNGSSQPSTPTGAAGVTAISLAAHQSEPGSARMMATLIPQILRTHESLESSIAESDHVNLDSTEILMTQKSETGTSDAGSVAAGGRKKKTKKLPPDWTDRLDEADLEAAAEQLLELATRPMKMEAARLALTQLNSETVNSINAIILTRLTHRQAKAVIKDGVNHVSSFHLAWTIMDCLSGRDKERMAKAWGDQSDETLQQQLSLNMLESVPNSQLSSLAERLARQVIPACSAAHARLVLSVMSEEQLCQAVQGMMEALSPEDMKSWCGKAEQDLEMQPAVRRRFAATVRRLSSWKLFTQQGTHVAQSPAAAAAAAMPAEPFVPTPATPRIAAEQPAVSPVAAGEVRVTAAKAGMDPSATVGAGPGQSKPASGQVADKDADWDRPVARPATQQVVEAEHNVRDKDRDDLDVEEEDDFDNVAVVRAEDPLRGSVESRGTLTSDGARYQASFESDAESDDLSSRRGYQSMGPSWDAVREEARQSPARPTLQRRASKQSKYEPVWLHAAASQLPDTASVWGSTIVPKPATTQESDVTRQDQDKPKTGESGLAGKAETKDEGKATRPRVVAASSDGGAVINAPVRGGQMPDKPVSATGGALLSIQSQVTAPPTPSPKGNIPIYRTAAKPSRSSNVAAVDLAEAARQKRRTASDAGTNALGTAISEVVKGGAEDTGPKREKTPSRLRRSGGFCGCFADPDADGDLQNNPRVMMGTSDQPLSPTVLESHLNSEGTRPVQVTVPPPATQQVSKSPSSFASSYDIEVLAPVPAAPSNPKVPPSSTTSTPRKPRVVQTSSSLENHPRILRQPSDRPSNLNKLAETITESEVSVLTADTFEEEDSRPQGPKLGHPQHGGSSPVQRKTNSRDKLRQEWPSQEIQGPVMSSVSVSGESVVLPSYAMGFVPPTNSSEEEEEDWKCLYEYEDLPTSLKKPRQRSAVAIIHSESFTPPPPGNKRM